MNKKQILATFAHLAILVSPLSGSGCSRRKWVQEQHLYPGHLPYKEYFEYESTQMYLNKQICEPGKDILRVVNFPFGDWKRASAEAAIVDLAAIKADVAVINSLSKKNLDDNPKLREAFKQMGYMHMLYFEGGEVDPSFGIASKHPFKSGSMEPIGYGNRVVAVKAQISFKEQHINIVGFSLTYGGYLEEVKPLIDIICPDLNYTILMGSITFNGRSNLGPLVDKGTLTEVFTGLGSPHPLYNSPYGEKTFILAGRGLEPVGAGVQHGTYNEYLPVLADFYPKRKEEENMPESGAREMEQSGSKITRPNETLQEMLKRQREEPEELIKRHQEEQKEMCNEQ